MLWIYNVKAWTGLTLEEAFRKVDDQVNGEDLSKATNALAYCGHNSTVFTSAVEVRGHIVYAHSTFPSNQAYRWPELYTRVHIILHILRYIAKHRTHK